MHAPSQPFDAITAFAVPNPNCSSQSQSVFSGLVALQVALPSRSLSLLRTDKFLSRQSFQPSTPSWFPINKNLWTSSFVLFSGGFCLFFLSSLYWVIEVKWWRGKWTMPILVLGMNAIVGFVADSLVYGPGYSFTVKTQNGASVSWHEVAQLHLMSFGLSVPSASLVYSLGAMLFCWLLLWLLWRKQIFIKI